MNEQELMESLKPAFDLMKTENEPAAKQRCPSCPELPGEILRAPGVYSLCPPCGGTGYVESEPAKPDVMFTKGPWYQGPEYYQSHIFVKTMDHMPIATVARTVRDGRSTTISGPVTEMQANARLISQSPAMFEALERAQKILSMLIDPGPISTSTVQSAFTNATACESSIRAILREVRGEVQGV